MSVPVRLAAFFAGLLAVFAVALTAGRAVGGGDDAQPDGQHRATAHGDDGMSMDAGAGHAQAASAHGLGVSENGLRLVAPSQARAGATAPFTFRIVDAHGAPVRRYAVEHTKRLHLIVVRRDLTGFQHLHPRQGPDGTWTTDLRVADPGAYRVIADFRPEGGAKTTLASDLLVAGDFTPRPFGSPTTTTTVDGYTVSLNGTAGAQHEGELAFDVARDGRPVAVQPYLGADGHLVALRQGDLAYLHVHPMAGSTTGRIAFAASYPSAAAYRLFLQFRAGGRVHTAAFTQEVPAA